MMYSILKGFLHYFSNLRDTSTRHLLFLFLVSHICVVTNSGSNFDLNYIQLFKTLDSVRSKLQGSIAEVLKTVPGLPKVILFSDTMQCIICFTLNLILCQDWLTLGRLCSPRVLFYFEQRPPFVDENLKPLQHLMEDQIYRLLRKCRVITNVW